MAVVGEVDMATAFELREHLVRLIGDGHHHLVIDLAGVEFMDSTGLAVLLEVLKRVHDHAGSLRLVCTREPILKILRVTGLDQLLPVYDDVFAAALAAGQARPDVDLAPLAAQELDPLAEQDANVT